MSASAVRLSDLATGVEFLALSGGQLGFGSSRQVFVYLRGTETPVAVFEDAAMSTPLNQPLTTGTAGVPGGIPGFVMSGQSIDFVDVASGAVAHGEALAAADVIGPDGLIGTGNVGLDPAAVAAQLPAATMAVDQAWSQQQLVTSQQAGAVLQANGQPVGPSQVGADASGAAAQAQTNALSAVSSEAQRAQLAEGALAPKASPTFSGTVSVPNVTAGDSSQRAVNSAFVSAAIAALVNNAPATLATLGQIAAELSSDESAAAALTNVVATKAPLAAIFGGLTASTSTLTSSQTLTANSRVQISNAASTSTATYTLPSPTTLGRIIVVEREDNGLLGTAGPIVISGSIRGSAGTNTLSLQYESIAYLDTGTTWQPFAGHKTLTSLTAYFNTLFDAAGAAASEATRAKGVEATLAPQASPTFTGTVTVPNVTAGDNSQKAVNSAFVTAAIAALVNSAPATLATLGQIAAQLQSDESGEAALVNTVATKAPLASVFGGLTAASVLTAGGNLTANTRQPLSNASSTTVANFALPTPSTLGRIIIVERQDDGTLASAATINVTGSIRGVAGSSLPVLLQYESIAFLDSGSTWLPFAGHKTLSSLDARYVLASAKGVANGVGTLDPTGKQPTSQLANSVQNATSAATVLIGWALAQQFAVTSATRNANEVITTANVVWPDGSTGVFTTDTINATFNTIDAFHVTYVPGANAILAANHTVTQAAVTRDSSGAVTAQPTPTVS